MEAGLDRREYGAERGTPTAAAIGQLIAPDIRSSLKVINGPAEVFGPLDNMIAVEAGGRRTVRAQPIGPLIGAFVDRVDQRAPLLKDSCLPIP